MVYQVLTVNQDQQDLTADQDQQDLPGLTVNQGRMAQ